MLCLFACNNGTSKGISNQSKELKIERFEQELLDTPSADLQSHLVQLRGQYNSKCLNIYPEDPAFMDMVAGFRQDSTIQFIYSCINKEYRNLDWLEKELSRALDRTEALDESIHIDKVFTMLNGSFDYSNRVYCEGNEVVISIDQYVLPDMECYRYFDMPMYLVNLCKKEYILPDCIAAIVRNHVALPEEPLTMLDYMIMEGKTLYLVNEVLPKVADTLKIRYTKDQLDWMQTNEKNVWSYFMQGKLLYETDYRSIQNFISEAPKTNAFKDSAPRTAIYIGWQIVEQYMKRNKVTISELMANTDSQSILQNSGYRP